MKRLISIFLVFLVLFNALGFYGLLVGLQYKAGLDMVARLDSEQYEAEETVTFRVPMAIPYHIDGAFQRVNGEIEYNGEFFRLVKQKIQSDTLYIVCIKDNNSKAIKRALTDYVKTFTDKPVSAKQSAKFMAGLIKDFLPSAVKISAASPGWHYTVDYHSPSIFFHSIPLNVYSPPPRG